MADRLELIRNLRRHPRERLMCWDNAAELGVSHDQKNNHADRHDSALERVRIHDALNAAGENIGGNNDRIDHERHFEIHIRRKSSLEKPRRPNEDCRCIKRHEDKDHKPRKGLDKTRIKTLA